MRARFASILLATLTVAGCESALDPAGARSDGLAETARTGGPVVVWDVTARPLPEIPLPNDQATRIDPTSPTGHRLNVSLETATAHERETREIFNELDGFGTNTPITVSFDRALDLRDLLDRRRENNDFRDDALFLLNVDPKCARFGEEVSLEVGRGRHPVTLFSRAERIPDPEAPDGYRMTFRGNMLFPFDERAELNSILFEERNEDRNGNGVLDPGEDTDRDGVLDVANFLDPKACDGFALHTVAYDRCVADNLMTFYERESNTLIVRPVWSLEQQCTYAVVLTKRLRGEDGRPVESPFAGVNPRDQTEALAPVPSLLSRYGLTKSDIAFAWTFTTGTMTRDLEALRAGLYGNGPFARLRDEFPVSSWRLWTNRELTPEARLSDLKNPDDTFLEGACAGAGITLLWGEGQREYRPNLCALENDFLATGLMFGGSFRAPNLLVDKDGIATPQYPADDDEHWVIDYRKGEAVYGETEVTFHCTLPLEKAEGCTAGNPDGEPFCKPFPVILYAHGYGSSRREVLSHSGRHNAMGYAACGVDSYGHGLNRAQEDPAAAQLFELADLFMKPWKVASMSGMATRGRDRDLNNDGLSDPGADMWTANLFHTRDMVRQSVLEYSQLVRILRHMDGTTRDASGRLLGDVDGDGTVDLGGPTNTISGWGISLGGILMGVLAGAEPSLDAVSPNAGGAGLTDITVRLGQGGLPEAVMLPMLGPYIVGCLPTDEHQRPLAEGETTANCMPSTGLDAPQGAGVMRLAYYAHDTAKFKVLEFGSVAGVRAGDRVELRNLNNGEVGRAWVDPRGYFRVSVASDALDAVEKRRVVGLVDGDKAPKMVPDPTRVGDRLVLVFFQGDTEVERVRVTTIDRDVTFQGAIHPANTPLVALQKGLGYQRNTPRFRRFVGIAQAAIAPADPGVWATTYLEEPIDTSYDPFAPTRRTRVLLMPTNGDNNVPAATGIAQGRAAGLFGSWKRDPARFGPEVGWREIHAVDPRFGQSIDEELIDRYVVEGDDRFQRYDDNPINPNVLYDIDDSSDGALAFTCLHAKDWSADIGENGCPDEVDDTDVTFSVPRPATGNALRIDRPRGDGSFDAFRIPMLRPVGQHGIYNAQPFRAFDADAFMVNLTIRFLGTRGRRIDHNPGCDCSASRIGSFWLNTSKRDLAGGPCNEERMNVCTSACAEAWGIETPEKVVCTTR